jgi:hypothetical protein
MAHGFLYYSSLIDVGPLSIRCDEGFGLDRKKMTWENATHQHNVLDSVERHFSLAI